MASGWSTMSVLDSWWQSDPARKFAAYIAKHMPPTKGAAGASK
jgi:hypothetical protein